MNSLSLLESLQAVTSAIAAIRLMQFGCGKRQPALLGFLVFIALCMGAQATADPRSARYFWIYLASNVVGTVVSICAVREMFSLTFEKYPGIRTGGRWVLYGVTAACAVIAMVLTAVLHHDHRASIHLYYFEVLNRSIVFTLAVAVVAVLLFLSRYPLHLSRNTYVSTGFFGVIFLSDALASLFDSMSSLLYLRAVDEAELGFAALCYLGWAVMFRRESLVPVTRVVFESPKEHELLQQLDSLNRLLGRVGRQ